MGDTVIQAGSQLGHYTIIRRLGAGGMAEVFLASQEGAAGFHREVAIKIVRPDEGDEGLVTSLINEAQLAAQLAHPNIVQVIDFGTHEAGFYLVMEYLSGRTLDQLIRRRGGHGRALGLDVIVDVVSQILDALDFAHSAKDSSGRHLSVVHRDIKPSNIMVSEIGLVKLLDFGIARANSIERRTATGMSKGTPAYMSPEQLRGREVGPPADLFAVGVLLFELATGRTLFTGTSFMELVRRRMEGFTEADAAALKSVCPELLPIVEKALQQDPEDRWPDARSMLTELRALCAVSIREPTRDWMNLLDTEEVEVPILNTGNVQAVDPTLAAPRMDSSDPAQGAGLADSNSATEPRPRGEPEPPATRLMVAAKGAASGQRTRPSRGVSSEAGSRRGAWPLRWIVLVGILALVGLAFAVAVDPDRGLGRGDVHSEANGASESEPAASVSQPPSAENDLPLADGGESGESAAPAVQPATQGTKEAVEEPAAQGTAQPATQEAVPEPKKLQARPSGIAAALPAALPGSTKTEPESESEAEGTKSALTQADDRRSRREARRLRRERRGGDDRASEGADEAAEASAAGGAEAVVFFNVLQPRSGDQTYRVFLPDRGRDVTNERVSLPVGEHRIVLRTRDGETKRRLKLQVSDSQRQRCVWDAREGRISRRPASGRLCRVD